MDNKEKIEKIIRKTRKYNCLRVICIKEALRYKSYENELKIQADQLFTKLGIDIPTAIRMFLKQIMRSRILFAVTASADFYNPFNLQVLETVAKKWSQKRVLLSKE